ncbi:helix-turn-helix domain-containing protein [Clostridium sp. DL1XJH146]
MDNVKTGEKIKELRIAKNLTQKVLAEKSEISRSNLNRIEIGKVEPRIETLMKISKVLGHELIGYHMAHSRNNITEYAERLGKKEFDIFYGLVEHVSGYYCENTVDPKVILENDGDNYKDLKDLLISVVKSRLEYYSKEEK